MLGGCPSCIHRLLFRRDIHDQSTFVTSTDLVSIRRDDPLTKSLGIVIGVLILLVGIVTYGVLLILFAFPSFLLLSRRWASFGWAILSGTLVGVGFAAGSLAMNAVW
jgi:hypothetical protein